MTISYAYNMLLGNFVEMRSMGQIVAYGALGHLACMLIIINQIMGSFVTFAPKLLCSPYWSSF